LSPTLSPSTGRGSHAWEGQLKFFPARYAKTFQTWHENIRDWCISRQLWWGHRIPVWSRVGAIEVTAQSGGLQQSVLGVQIAETLDDTFGIRELMPGAVMTTANVMLADGRRASKYFVCVAPDHPEIESQLESEKFEQDPDVLDTWFSSGLWPLSTLNWPQDTPELAKWNPTHTLCTAREIITLWVSRMVMFNLYFLDRLPYTDVFIHAMIQDGEGRKMSKSLGNGVDPLDIISSHGADAMRFTLTLMTTNTQDVRMPVERDPKTGKNTSPKFDIGRNFCNKVWNAVRFALLNLEGATENTENTEKGKNSSSVLSVSSVSSVVDSLADRWIVSRFNRTVAACDDALSNYRFDQYAKSCYDFFWGDLCDWYLEAIKPAMRDPARQAQTANVLAAVLDGSLRLLHPMIPFITEVIYWRLNAVRPERGLPGRIMGCTSARLIRAAWPRVGEFSEAAEALFPKLQEIIGAIRNLRNEYKADPKKRVTVSISAPGDCARTIDTNREIIELLAICALRDVKADLAAPANAVRATAAGCEIFIEGLVDEGADRERNAKRRDELVKSIGAMKGRLANPSYVQKAPPHLVKQTQDQLAELEAELAKMG
ncbi:MAG: class I tRNA ligase family protein, partial [Tepidisphaeraceae bacterium]